MRARAHKHARFIVVIAARIDTRACLAAELLVTAN